MRRLLLPVGLAWVGGLAGLYVGAAVTPPGSGLAGPAGAVACGMIGAVLGLVAGAAAAWKLPQALMPAVSNVVAGLAIAGFVVFGMSIMRAWTNRPGGAEAPSAEPAFFAVSASRPDADDGSTFVRIEVDGARGTFRMVSRKQPGQPTCRGAVGAPERTVLVDALRRLDALDAQATQCQDDTRPVMTLEWSLFPSEPGRSARVTEACIAAHPEFTALYVPLENLAFGAEARPGALVCGPP